MDDGITAVLDQAFPDRAVREMHSTGPSWNEKNHTVEVEFVGGESTYLKIATDEDGSRIARERAVISHVGANSEVSVPTIVASDASGETPYLATAPVGGDPLIDLWAEASEVERVELTRAVGAALASVHDHRFAEHGLVTGGDGGSLELDTGPWTDVLVGTIGEAREIASSNRFDDHFDRVIEAVDANRDLLDDAPAALCHGDPAQPNCFRGDDRIGFLDWELAHVGDPARDLHRARDQQLGSLRSAAPETLVTALCAGYRERAGGLPAGFRTRRPVYDAVRFLGVSGFFEKYATVLDEPTEDLAGWVNAEMERRFDAIE